MRTAASSRANRLVSLRDLVALGVSLGITDRRRLSDLAIERGVFLTERDRRHYSYSSVYRYLDSLRSLQFEVAESIGEPMVWSRAALALAEAAQNTQFTSELSENEREIFREQVFVSKAANQFLSCFCPPGNTPHSRDELLRDGRPLYVLGTVKTPQVCSGGSRKDTDGRTVRIALDPDTGKSEEKPQQEFLYTYRLWCLDSELIEELNIAEAVRNGIPRSQSFVLFPVRAGMAPSEAQFVDAIYATVGSRPRPYSVAVPRLMYKLCVDLRITVETFKGLLLRVWASNRDLFHLERGPAVLIKGDFSVEPVSYGERYRNQRYYIVLDHTVRTHLVVFPRGR
jgi:hypothetical protein